MRVKTKGKIQNALASLQWEFVTIKIPTAFLNRAVKMSFAELDYIHRRLFLSETYAER